MNWKRKRIRIKVGIALGAAALAVTPVTDAAVKVTGVDTTQFPRVRLSVVTSKPSAKPPVLKENGKHVGGLQAENLADAKSVVLAVDRSRSMDGKPFADAVAAAQAFLRAKGPDDRVAVATFAREAMMLTPFSSVPGDAHTALSSLKVDNVQGTTLFDGIAKSARAFATESNLGRVVVVVTDGNETRSTATLESAINAARDAGVVVYVVGIESKQFNPTPLKRLAHDTGGSYRGTGSSSELKAVYGAIAAELRRTWRVEYLTAARAGDSLKLDASVPKLGAAATTVKVAGDSSAATSSSPPLPDTFYESFLGTQVVGILVGLMVLLAGTFLLTSVRGSRLRRRLAPHVQGTAAAGKRRQERERLQAAAGLFRATERTFGHWRHWVAVSRMLERSDVPLRTVEFVYITIGAALAAGLLGATLFRQGTFTILLIMLCGAGVPWGVVWFMGRRRTRAFENQLPDLLITLAASLKAGHSFKQGLQTVVDEGRPPASKELKRVLTEAQLGRPIDDSLQEMAARLGSKNFEFVITAVTIQRQVGGSLAGLIDMVADTVRQRQQFIRKIRGLTAMGRAGSYVLMGLPFFIAFVITIMNSEYMDPLYHTSTGHWLIAIGLAMMVFGSLVLHKIVSFKG